MSRFKQFQRMLIRVGGGVPVSSGVPPVIGGARTAPVEAALVGGRDACLALAALVAFASATVLIIAAIAPQGGL